MPPQPTLCQPIYRAREHFTILFPPSKPTSYLLDPYPDQTHVQALIPWSCKGPSIERWTTRWTWVWRLGNQNNRVRFIAPKMYGENSHDSSGRKVSLLNDELSRSKSNRPRLDDCRRKSISSSPSSMSREDYTTNSSRNSASPGFSPTTPQLVRSNSSSSDSLGTQSTPSPMTPPNYPFEPLEHPKTSTPYFTYPRTNGTHHNPAMPQAQDPAAQPYYHPAPHRINEFEMDDNYSNLGRSSLQPIQTQFAYNNTDLALNPSPSSISSPAVAPTTSTPTNASPSTVKPLKKKYPCPHAARFSCSDTFTTSGHAARHGKKHTGEKNVHCPTCNKAFTRKDNMKQHERTHKNNRVEATTSAVGSKSSSSISAGTRTRRPTLSNDPPTPPASLDDPSAMDLDYRTARHLDGGLSMHRSEFSDAPVGSTSGRSEEDGEGESPGLDALATAASEMVDA